MPGQGQHLSEPWSGILPLAPPHSITLWLLLSSAILLLLVTGMVYLLWRHSPRQRAIRTLRQCQQQLQTGAADPKQIGQIAYRSLLQGMALNPAHSHTVAGHAKNDWQTFYRRFQYCVFQASPAKDELGGLIQQACDWLRRRPL